MFDLIATHTNRDREVRAIFCNSVMATNSIWPNANYRFKSNFIQSNSIGFDQLLQKVDEGVEPKLFFFEKIDDIQFLRSKNIYPIDSWRLMELNGAAATDKQINSQPYIFMPINNEAGLQEWLQVVSLILFHSKAIDAKIIQHLLQKNVQLYALFIDGKIMGTTMVYTDENNVAGIYMVGISKEHQGKGWGKILLNQTIALTQKAQPLKIVLQSTRGWLNFYKSLGFYQNGNVYLFFKIK